MERAANKMFDIIRHDEKLLDHHILRQNQEDFDPINIEKYALNDPRRPAAPDMLKQLLNEPDYASSVAEQKAQALSRLAAYTKSAEILKLIKGRIGENNDDVRRYMVNELSKTGGDLAEFMASEIKITDKRSPKDVQKASAAHLQAAVEKQAA